MKMTKEQVAELLLKANEHFSNVEEYIYVGDKKQWRDNRTWNIESILYNISKNDSIYRIKDNAVKEITLDLLGKTVISKEKKAKGIITFVFLGDEYTNAYLHIRNEAYNLISFNKEWQLVED